MWVSRCHSFNAFQNEHRGGGLFAQRDVKAAHQFRAGADFFATVEVFDRVALIWVEAAQFHGERFGRGSGTAEGLHDAFVQIGAMELPRNPRCLVEAVRRERVVVAKQERADAARFSIAADRVGALALVPWSNRLPRSCQSR